MTAVAVSGSMIRQPRGSLDLTCLDQGPQIEVQEHSVEACSLKHAQAFSLDARHQNCPHRGFVCRLYLFLKNQRLDCGVYEI